MAVTERNIMSKTRFDLEQDLLSLNSTTDDLDNFLQMYYDAPTKMTEDDIYNYVFGIRNVLKLRFEKAWDTYLQHFELDAYAKNNIAGYAPVIRPYDTNAALDSLAIKKEVA